MIKTKCPYCGYVATHHETIEGNDKFKDGDISFCIGCGEVGEYKDNKIIKTNVNDFDKETQEGVKKIRLAWLRTKKLAELKK